MSPLGHVYPVLGLQEQSMTSAASAVTGRELRRACLKPICSTFSKETALPICFCPIQFPWKFCSLIKQRFLFLLIAPLVSFGLLWTSRIYLPRFNFSLLWFFSTFGPSEVHVIAALQIMAARDVDKNLEKGAESVRFVPKEFLVTFRSQLLEQMGLPLMWILMMTPCEYDNLDLTTRNMHAEMRTSWVSTYAKGSEMVLQHWLWSSGPLIGGIPSVTPTPMSWFTLHIPRPWWSGCSASTVYSSVPSVPSSSVISSCAPAACGDIVSKPDHVYSQGAFLKEGVASPVGSGVEPISQCR